MTMQVVDFDLRSLIRNIPDHPKPGIIFRDITTLLGSPRAFRRAVDEVVQPWSGSKIDKVAGVEARGFILGGAVAHQISAGFPHSLDRQTAASDRAHGLSSGIWQ
jgi:adenine phosphoribosyltransferase